MKKAASADGASASAERASAAAVARAWLHRALLIAPPARDALAHSAARICHLAGAHNAYRALAAPRVRITRNIALSRCCAALRVARGYYALGGKSAFGTAINVCARTG
jgi:hypothetical protein